MGVAGLAGYPIGYLAGFPAGNESRRRLTFVRHHVDFSLARRAVLRDFRAGRRPRIDICDAHSELLRAGRNLGTPAAGDCPICGQDGLRIVAYVYGDQLRRANGRCISNPAELEKLVARHEEFWRYLVEVCIDCGWNHLLRRELHGQRYAG